MIGIRFRIAGKICYFDAKGKKFKVGQNVIVETAKGIESGEVILVDVEDVEVTAGNRIIRLVNEEDEKTLKANRAKEKEAFFICKEKIFKHKLNMKLIEAEYLFDGNKLLFYFTSEDRIDFRDLVKELASIFRTRIELRQIGVRDETKMCGGIGICGRKLCCSTFLENFHPVSIKMAKDQNLSLNPVKISGICGRLMCCLKYEEDCYVEIREKLPDIGDIVLTPDGKGEVLAVNVLREQIKVAVKMKDKDEKEAIFYNSSDIKIKKKCNKHCSERHDNIV